MISHPYNIYVENGIKNLPWETCRASKMWVRHYLEVLWYHLIIEIIEKKTFLILGSRSNYNFDKDDLINYKFRVM